MGRHRSTSADRRIAAWIVAVGLLALVAAMVQAYTIAARIHDSSLNRSLNTSLMVSSPAELESEEWGGSERRDVDVNPVEGQTVYVPAYSHIYHGAGEPYLLTTTLSIRNTSLDDEIILDSVRYFDMRGRSVKSYLDEPVHLPALGTTEIVVERDGTSGGSGANFLVEWYAKRPVTEPIVEAVMVATSSQQGISFVRLGAAIKVAVSRGEAPAKPTDAVRN